MITTILRNCTRRQLEEAYNYAACCLHIHPNDLTDVAAVAYVCRHFESGQLTGWDGFIQDLEG